MSCPTNPAVLPDRVIKLVSNFRRELKEFIRTRTPTMVLLVAMTLKNELKEDTSELDQ